MQLKLNGVTIVDTRDGTLARDMTIVMDDGKIAKIAPSATAAAADGVDARGKFVVPGDLDCHAHPLNSADPEGQPYTDAGQRNYRLPPNVRNVRKRSKRGAPGNLMPVVPGARTARDGRADSDQGQRRNARRRGRRSSQPARSGSGLSQSHRRDSRRVPRDRRGSEAAGDAFSRTSQSGRFAGGRRTRRHALDRTLGPARLDPIELLDRGSRIAQARRAERRRGLRSPDRFPKA